MTSEPALIRTRSFVLKPTTEQAEKFSQFSGVARLVYNLGLEQRSTFWRQYLRANGRRISWVSQCNEVTKLRAEFDFIRAVHSEVPQQAVIDLDRAFQAYFSKRSKYPQYRNKASHMSFRTRGNHVSVRKISAKWSEIRVPGIGWVKYRDTRPLGGKPKYLTVSLQGGSWTASVSCSVAPKDRAPAAAVGIDRGVANTITLSTGSMYRLPPRLDALERRRRKAQRVLARRQRGSKRYAEQRARVATISAKIVRIRTDWLHRHSSAIASQFSHVAIENLNIAGMTASASGTVDVPGTRVAQKRGLNRSILNQGWGIFAHQLAYKLEDRDGRLALVDARNTSRTCSACGAINAESRKSQARFACVDCGHEEHADVGAAKEILRRSTVRLDAEGSRMWPGETSTRGVAA